MVPRMEKSTEYKKIMVPSIAKNPDKEEIKKRNSQPHKDQKTNETGQNREYPLSSTLCSRN